MLQNTLDERIIECGESFFRTIKNEKPVLFNKSKWIGKVLDWSMTNEAFKVNLFRFVDVFPSLKSAKSLTKHINEYFGEDKNMPPIVKWGAKGAHFTGVLGGNFLNSVIRFNIKNMAMQFIIGENTESALNNLEKLRDNGFAFVIDFLGEATVSEDESEFHYLTYLSLLDALAKKQSRWQPLSQKEEIINSSPFKDWGYYPKTQIAIKVSALYSQVKAVDFENSVQKILQKLEPIYEKIIKMKGSLSLDMESFGYKDIVLEVYRRLRSNSKFAHYPHLGIVLQAYLQCTENDLNNLLIWAKNKNLPIEVRLVKGAYWDYETVIASQNNWTSACVWNYKHETDAAFERLSKKILENHAICYFACGSHNVRSICVALEMAKQYNVPENRYEFQMLYGMAEPVRNVLRNIAGRVRLYCPYGEMIPGMAYLVRRLLENTSNESFLRQGFAEGEEIEKLLQNPQEKMKLFKPKKSEKKIVSEIFQNEPAVDFTLPGEIFRFKKSIALVRKQFVTQCPLFINGKRIYTDDLRESRNPNNFKEIIGKVSLASKKEVEMAINAAKRTFPAWRDTSAEDRSEYLLKAADEVKQRIYELCSWQILEVGKQWDQAYADVTEAIDFLRYYAIEMRRLAKAMRLGNISGEINLQFYEPQGVVSVIAPWNFPLAISLGMISAAIVTGNTLVYKPSGLSPIVGYSIVDIFEKVGVPAGVFNYLSGNGSEIGDLLVEHKDVSIIAFTGSKEVGLKIIEKASVVQPGQVHVKKIICEMGGKNAIIIDDDANLDEAIPAVIHSAFAFQGQKCSACSRLIVLDEIYEPTIERLVKAVESQKIGSPEDPVNFMGAVIDAKAQEKILKYQKIATSEGKVIFQSNIPCNMGYYVPIMIVEGITPENRIAQEEVFGPVLAVMRVKDFNQALEWANSTQYALTGGIFSRSPKNIEKAKQEFRVGNLYINRGCTGALVGRQPFGGAYMSGMGTKAGGPDYLLHFMHARVVTENTMRRGFTPSEKLE